MALLEVENLTVRYEPQGGTRRSTPSTTSPSPSSRRVRRPDRRVRARARPRSAPPLLRLLQTPGRISRRLDHVRRQRHHDDDPRTSCARCAGRDISTVFQSSMNSLNPVVRIEAQFRDVIEHHTELRGDAVTGPDQRSCSTWS